MRSILRPLACAAALFCAGTAAAQTNCPNGAADDEWISLSVAVRAHPTRIAAMVDSVLRVQGYTVSSSPAGEGRWSIAPRFTWLEEAPSEAWTGARHPGVEMGVLTEARGDSTQVTVGARGICKGPPVPDDSASLEEMAEMLHATVLAGGVMEGLDSLEAAGIDPTTPVDRPGTSLEPPREVAGFHIVNRHDYPDPRFGTSLRYGRDGDDRYVDIYVYPGVEVTSACDAACAVDTEADGFAGSTAELVRAGHYQSFDLKRDERLRPGAGAAWAYGRHLTFRGKRGGETVDSQYYLYSFPGFFLKVRATYPQGSAAQADVQRFVDDLLRKLAGG
jgi:hypothetical protein